MKALFEVLRNGLIAVLVVIACLFLFAVLIAPPKLVLLDVISRVDADVNYQGMPVLPSRNGATFLYFGQSRVFVSAPDHEPVEIHFNGQANVFRGNAETSRWLGFVFLVDVRLYEKDPNLRMQRYRGVVTAGGNRPVQILPLHPRYRGTHQPIDVVKRRYENTTGRSVDSLRHLRLQVDSSGEVYLDFSSADGIATEYLPPDDWPTGNVLMRILYSMTAAPNAGYQSRLLVHRDQYQTPYDMGTTFFYCRFAGYFCGGRVSTFRNSRGVQEASVEIWHNTVQGDARLRYD